MIAFVFSRQATKKSDSTVVRPHASTFLQNFGKTLFCCGNFFPYTCSQYSIYPEQNETFTRSHFIFILTFRFYVVTSLKQVDGATRTPTPPLTKTDVLFFSLFWCHGSADAVTMVFFYSLMNSRNNNSIMTWMTWQAILHPMKILGCILSA